MGFTTDGSIRRAGLWLLACAVGAFTAGCNNKFFDPSQIGRFRPTPAVNVILESLGVAEEPVAAWQTAEEPRPEDIRAVKADYVLQPADIVTVSIYELLQEGAAVTSNYVVTETGKLSIPDVGIIQAAGLTESQLEEEIRKILSPAVLRNPSVMVTLLTSQQRAFSILGNAVPAPGRYFIPRHDYRLTDALATAQVNTQFNVSYIYVSRREGIAGGSATPTQGMGAAGDLGLVQPDSSRAGVPTPVKSPDATATTPRREIPEPLEPADKFEQEREMLDLIRPQAGAPGNKTAPRVSQTRRPNEDVSATMLPGGFRLLGYEPRPESPKIPTSGIVLSPTEFGSGAATSQQAPLGESRTTQRMEWICEDGKWKQVPAGTQASGQTEWVQRDGKWVQVPKGQTQPGPAKKPTAVQPAGPTLPLENSAIPTGWEQGPQARVIQIPTDRLMAGDQRYDIIIRPGDTIHVPVDLIGEFYITGHVNRAGTIPITGRPMTLKMAIAAAGGLGPLAVPKRVEVIRRIGTKREEIVLVDLDKIASGEQPDFFIKPNDLINVGTDATARWRAVLRNSFRAAYGFGFVYDRNFADVDYYESLSLPDWF
ncbi:MAG: polysaccharide biosynthesis/export family protein [Phycisphaerae bacterium]|nr:polysaccharide biosynthesis/export family protein [Phycisphaerae bacterium]